MTEDNKCYKIEACRGSRACSNRVVDDNSLIQVIDKLCNDYLLNCTFNKKITGHKQFKISLSFCPNGCSRPQIVDIGLIGACKPEVSEKPCSGCGDCVSVCKEDSITLDEEILLPSIKADKCLFCAECIRVCPTGTIIKGKIGYRILAGGRLGRHPRLGYDLGKIFTDKIVVEVITAVLKKTKPYAGSEERYSDIVMEAVKDFSP